MKKFDIPFALFQKAKERHVHPHDMSMRGEENTYREVKKIGLKSHFWTDIFHRFLIMHWTSFFIYFASLYLLINLIFGFIYFLIPSGIKNVVAYDFLNDFFFSVQTISTVGYGATYPSNTLTNSIMTIEELIGLLYSALATGLIFARFSRPTARVIFSDVATISSPQHDPQFCIRIGNMRSTPLVNVDIEVVLARSMIDHDGNRTLNFTKLPLLHSHIPLLRVSLPIVHCITEESPLNDYEHDNFAQANAEFIVCLTGIDPISSQNVFCCRIYSPEQIQKGYRFKELIRTGEHKEIEVNFNFFHTTEPDMTPQEEGDVAITTNETREE